MSKRGKIKLYNEDFNEFLATKEEKT